jgi:hypothetical protein
MARKKKESFILWQAGNKRKKFLYEAIYSKIAQKIIKHQLLTKKPAFFPIKIDE